MPNHAIVIGIKDYPGLTPLDGPCNDADEFLRWVADPDAGGVAPENIHKILSSDYPKPTGIADAKPLSDEIEAKFNEIVAGNPTQHVGDRIYVFVAGHGMSDIDRPESAALISANATNTAITLPHVVVTDLVHFFRRSYTFKEVILFMDCCLDTMAMRPLSGPGTFRTNPHPKAGDVRMFLANATLWSKKSFEKKFNGRVRGIFSVALMDALTKAPADDNLVTGEIVKNYIEENIKSIAGDKEIEKPKITGDYHEEIVFYKRNAAQAAANASAFRLRVNIEGAVGTEQVDLFDGDRELIDTKPVDQGGVSFQVAAGIYKVSIQGTNRSALIEVISDHEESL